MEDKMDQRISDEMYEQILENIPIACVDIIIHKNEEVLLIRRNEEPAKNEWWVVGGRILKGEKFEDAVTRKVKEEVGMNIEIEKQVGVYEILFDRKGSSNVRKGTHAIAIVYLTKFLEGQDVKIDETSIDYKWIDKIEESWHPYIKKVLKDSKVFD